MRFSLSSSSPIRTAIVQTLTRTSRCLGSAKVVLLWGGRDCTRLTLFVQQVFCEGDFLVDEPGAHAPAVPFEVGPVGVLGINQDRSLDGVTAAKAEGACPATCLPG